MSIALLAFVLGSWGCRSSGPNQADGGGQQKQSKNTGAPTVKVPDPHVSKDPKVGREAGLGDDQSNLEVADPNTGKASSGGRQAHATR